MNGQEKPQAVKNNGSFRELATEVMERFIKKGEMHELRNSLQACLGHGDIVKTILLEMKRTEQSSEKKTRLESVIENLDNLVIDLRKAEKRTRSLRLLVSAAFFQISSELENIITELENEGIQIILDLKESDNISFSPSALRGCVVNLFDNASRAMIEQNIPPEERYFKISTQKKESSIIVTFENPGVIIENATAEGNTSGKQTQGQDKGQKREGFGLSYIKFWVMFYEGTLEIKTTKKPATVRLIITLPIASPTA